MRSQFGSIQVLTRFSEFTELYDTNLTNLGNSRTNGNIVRGWARAGLGITCSTVREQSSVGHASHLALHTQQVAVAQVIRTSWLKRRGRAAAVLITSICDEELHTIQAVDDNLVLIRGRLREKFERRLEAKAETAQMS